MKIDIPTAIVTMIVTAVIVVSGTVAFLPDNTVRELTAEQQNKVRCYDRMQAMFDIPDAAEREQAQDELVDDELCWP